MGAKENILRDIHKLITTKFATTEEAFIAFDKDKDGALNKDEIKDLLKEAGVNGFITEPNGKSKDSNTAPTSDPVVAILVNGDKDSQCHQGHEN